MHEALPARVSVMTEEVIQGRLGENAELIWHNGDAKSFIRTVEMYPALKLGKRIFA